LTVLYLVVATVENLLQVIFIQKHQHHSVLL
jgi:hypothetical protein